MAITIPKQNNQEAIIDIIAPTAIKLSSTYLQIGPKFIKTIAVVSYPAYLNSGWLIPLINIDKILDISLFYHPLDSAKILKKMRKKLAEVQSQIAIEQEKGKVRDPQLEMAQANIEELRDRLTQGSEKFFRVGIYITLYANSTKELDEIENQINAILNGRMIFTKPVIFQQDTGFQSTLPLMNDKLFINAGLNTESASTTFPIISSDLTANKGIFYGINRHNNTLVLFDRFSLENSNMVIFGKSGGGKSYAAKLEILRSLMLGIDVIVIDPENEFQYLAQSVGGTIINISLSSKDHINPFDFPPMRENETVADLLQENIINLTGLLKIALGDLTPTELSILDRALFEVYASRGINQNVKPEEITGSPVLSDLKTILEGIEGAENIIRRLERYTDGSFAGFLNQPTNVKMDNRLVVFSIRDMQEELRPIAMYLILNFIWNLIRSELKKRIMTIDEAWLLLRYPEGAKFLQSIAKRARKYFFGLTTITQDIIDFLNSEYGKTILANSSLQFLFKQSPTTIEAVTQTFNLNEEEKFLLLEASVGEALLFAGTRHAAIKVVASYMEDQIITSDPSQLLAIQQEKEDFAKNL